MQILLFSLVILAIIIYIVYKIKNSFTKKELIGFIVIIFIIIASSIYLTKQNGNKLPNAFKQYYLKHKNIEVLKLSFSQQNVEMLSSNKSNSIYNFDYIISKDGKEFVCHAKNIQVIKIEDEYIFNNFKEECKLK